MGPFLKGQDHEVCEFIGKTRDSGNHFLRKNRINNVIIALNSAGDLIAVGQQALHQIG